MPRITASAAIFLLLSAAPVAAERWVPRGSKQTGGTMGRIYWDADSLILDEGRLRLRSRIVFEKPTVPQQYGSPVKTIRSDFDINCDRQTGRHVISQMYDQTGGVVFTVRGARGDTLVPVPGLFDVCDEARKKAS